ncbi:MAG: outer membrane protein assembly factor BamD [Aeoliella sp.]
MNRLQSIAASVFASSCLATAGCAMLPTSMSERLPTWGSTAATAAPGTAQWWKANRKRAELVPDQGFRVPGVPGFFDENGRPMDAPLAEEALVLELDDEDSTGLLPGLDPKKGYAKAKAAVGLGPNRERARSAYNAGLKLYGEQKYARAAKRFQEAAERWPSSTIEQQALYQLGECYFFDKKYVEARDTYVKLLEKHPNSGQVDNVVEKLWSIGKYWEEYEGYNPDWPITPNLLDRKRPTFDTLGHAIKTYENIQLYDPTGPRADDAIMATAGIYFRTERFNDADEYYKLLRQQYPRSEFQFEAHLLGLQTKLRQYQGPEYDGASLEGAKKLATQLRTQFGNRLSPDERERLSQTQAEVAREVAERDMQMARHYEKTEHYGSARFYYAEVAKKHPQSQLAAEARTRIAQIADEAATPEERLAWLIDLFPENPERTRVARVPELRDSRTSETRVADGPDGESVER